MAPSGLIVVNGYKLLYLVQGDFVAIRQLNGDFSCSRDFALLPIAESDGAASFGLVVREPLEIWGYVKCGARVQQPRVCVLRTVMDFSDCGVL